VTGANGEEDDVANDEGDYLTGRFEESRSHLRAVAYRMLGSVSEADDAVQEAWLRLSRSDTTAVNNLAGWLTTVVARVCLDMLRTRKSRREEPLDAHGPGASAGEHAGSAGESRADGASWHDPEAEAMLASSVGPALLLVLDTLAPAERLAFVLHDMFAVPFEDIASIVGRSPAAARQLASRARRRIQGEAADPDRTSADRPRQRAVVEAFFAASREGKFEALLALLDPAVVLRADAAFNADGSFEEIRGPEAVARFFAGRAAGARLAYLNGSPGAVWAPGGNPRVAFAFTLVDGKVAGIDMLADPKYLEELDLEFFDR
jgi:RNA polymerase sigma factor (sigma-70 family)